jgi:hypothetical protein
MRIILAYSASRFLKRPLVGALLIDAEAVDKIIAVKSRTSALKRRTKFIAAEFVRGLSAKRSDKEDTLCHVKQATIYAYASAPRLNVHSVSP